MGNSSSRGDVLRLTGLLRALPTEWEGKPCVLELKSADYQWRQMEWWAFYFEFKARALLQGEFQMPGDRFGRVSFDLKGAINWDLKAKAIKSDSHGMILNDKDAMDQAVVRYGYHGAIVALCDVEYNDENRSFQKWHTRLKGGKSNYERDREQRTAISRYRKTRAQLREVLFLVFDSSSLSRLSLMHQGRNSDGSPRKVKYMCDDLEHLPVRPAARLSF